MDVFTIVIDMVPTGQNLTAYKLPVFGMLTIT